MCWNVKYRAQIETYIQNDLEGKSAHDTTQYLRGHLYTYSDYLLRLTFTSEDLPEIILFMKSLMRLVVSYLKKVAKMQKSLYELA